MQLKGDEKQIRFLLNAIYWVAFHGQDWPFRTVKHDYVVQMRRDIQTQQFDPVTSLQLDMFLGLCRTRVGTGFPMTSMKSYQDIFPGNNYFTAALLEQRMYPTLDKESLSNENQFLQFYFHIVLSSRANGDDAFTELYYYLKKIGGIAWDFTTQFFQFLEPYQRHNEPALTGNHMLVANFARSVVSIIVMQGHRFDLDDFSAAYFIDDNSSAMSQLMYKYFDQETGNPEYASLRPYRQELHHNLVMLLAPYMQSVQSEDNVNVYLLTEHNGFYSRVLEIFLHDLGFVHIMTETADPADADLIITSLANPVMLKDQLHIDPRKVFIWYADENSKQYYELYVRLRDLYQNSFIDASSVKAKPAVVTDLRRAAGDGE